MCGLIALASNSASATRIVFSGFDWWCLKRSCFHGKTLRLSRWAVRLMFGNRSNESEEANTHCLLQGTLNADFYSTSSQTLPPLVFPPPRWVICYFMVRQTVEQEPFKDARVVSESRLKRSGRRHRCWSPTLRGERNVRENTGRRVGKFPGNRWRRLWFSVWT